MPEVIADTKQLVILKRITAMLEELTLPGSDTTTFAGRVYRGRTVLGGESPPPAFSLLESPKPDLIPVVGGENKINQSTLWTLLLQGFTVDQKTHPTDLAYAMKGLAEQRLSAIIELDKRGNPVSPADYLIPHNGVKLITGLAIGPGVVRPPEANISPTAFFYLPLVVNLTLDVSKPFAVGP